MRLYRLSLLAFGFLGAGLCQPGSAGIPTLPYDLVDWPTEARTAAGTPAGPWNLIQTPGVAIDSRGHVLVLHRGAHPILEFEPSGKFVRSWGDGMFSEGKVVRTDPAHRVAGGSGYTAVYGPAGCDSCGAHAIRVDPEGSIWAIDAPGQVVYKMNPQGRVILQLGQKGVAGAGPNHFNLPTDVGFAPNGDFYVTDGYGSARVVKYTRDGKYLLQWGARGTGPGQFGLPHGLVVDSQGRVYVTDRDNQRVQVFDSSGKFLKQWPTVGGVSGLGITKDQHIWTGGVLVNLDGKVLGMLPHLEGTAHGVAITDSGDVYLGLLSGKVQKFVKKAASPAAAAQAR